jgi:ClpP class serine protease
MSLDTISRLAQGKIYNGQQAQQKRLVDKTGDLYQALHFAHKKADLPGEEPNVIPLKGEPWQRFLGQFGQRGGFWHNLLRSLYLLGQGPPHALQREGSAKTPQTWYQKARETNHDYLIQYLYRP